MKPKATTEENNTNLNKENYFRTPEGYFEKLPLAINQKIESNKIIHFDSKQRTHRLLFVSAMAAALITVVLVFSFLIKKETTPDTGISFWNDAEQAVTEYLEENLDEMTLVEASKDELSFFDADKLKEIIASDDSINQKQENNFTMDTTLKKDDILDYLINENIDPETL